jgi:uridylate kinase
MIEPIVISLGGSTFVKERIDTKFLRQFKRIVLSQAKKRKVFIYVGGGATARKYQEALSGDAERDWAGIYATRLNAQFLRIFLGSDEEKIIEDPTKPVKTKKRVVLAAGWKPGWSTDYDAVLLAENVGAKMVVNLTNVDYVYDKDPNKFKDAKAFRTLTWQQYKQIIGGKWTPGLHTPFDPVAAREASTAKINVVIINGSKLKEFEAFLKGRPFKGTLIRSSSFV